MAMQTTNYDSEKITEFWNKARTFVEQIETGVKKLQPLWGTADEACKGIPTIPASRKMVDAMVPMAAKLSEAVDTGFRDNKAYIEEAQGLLGNGVGDF